MRSPFPVVVAAAVVLGIVAVAVARGRPPAADQSLDAGVTSYAPDEARRLVEAAAQLKPAGAPPSVLSCTSSVPQAGGINA